MLLTTFLPVVLKVWSPRSTPKSAASASPDTCQKCKSIMLCREPSNLCFSKPSRWFCWALVWHLSHCSWAGRLISLIHWKKKLGRKLYSKTQKTGISLGWKFWWYVLKPAKEIEAPSGGPRGLPIASTVIGGNRLRDVSPSSLPHLSHSFPVATSGVIFAIPCLKIYCIWA